jgi:hypothetical protein
MHPDLYSRDKVHPLESGLFSFGHMNIWAKFQPHSLINGTQWNKKHKKKYFENVMQLTAGSLVVRALG